MLILVTALVIGRAVKAQEEENDTLGSELMAYWPLDGSLVDVIGGNHGRSRDLKEEPFAPSLMGKALRLQGEGHFEVVSDEALFGLLPSTFAFWVRVDNQTGNIIFSNAQEGRIEFRSPGYLLGSGHLVPETQSIPPQSHSEWHHVVVRSVLGNGPHLFNSTYVNGQLVETTIEVQGRSFMAPSGSGVTKRIFVGGDPRRVPTLQGSLDELAFWQRSLREDEVEMLYAAGLEGRSLRQLLLDVDGDLLPDIWEVKRGLDPAIPNGADDTDGDSLGDLIEFELGTDPSSTDTDGDTLSDAEELTLEMGSSDPIWKDSDEDGINDNIELMIETDHIRADTDGDGYRDGDELELFSDPTDPNSKPDIGVGLIGYWSFDDNFIDIQQGAEGTILPEGSELELAEGMLGNALRMDDEQYVDVSVGDEFGFERSSFSISCWALLKNPGQFGNRRLISCSIGRKWRLEAVLERPELGWIFYVPRGENLTVRDLSRVALWDLQDRRWHHIVGVYRSRKGGSYGTNGTAEHPRIYIDGVPVEIGRASDSSLAPSAPPGTGLRLGGPKDINGLNRWDGLVDDLAIWSRAITLSEIRAIYRGAVLEHKAVGELLSPDSDFDGLPDVWEERHGLDPNLANDQEDVDGDSLTNLQEYQKGLDPISSDTDEDGLRDDVETDTGIWLSADKTGTNPLVADTDGDGLADGLEIWSDPNRQDTDGDGLADGVEIHYNADPRNSDSLPLLRDGLLAHWPLNGNADALVGNYQSRIYGQETLLFVDGRHGGSAQFNGIDQYIEVIDDNGDFDLSHSSFAISAWFKIDTIPCQPSDGGRIECPPGFDLLSRFGILSKGAGIHQLNASIDARGDLLFHSAFEGSLPVATGKWNQLVGVVDHYSGLTFTYLNGVLSKTSLAFVQDTDYNLTLGAIPKEGRATHYWLGSLDDIAIWKRPLAPTEVAMLWSSGKGLDELANMVRGADSDGDGASDDEEAIAGTNPDDGNDFLRITQVSRIQRGILLHWDSVAGKRYDIEYSESLKEPKWNRVNLVGVAATRSETAFLDTSPSTRSKSKGYYRVAVRVD